MTGFATRELHSPARWVVMALLVGNAVIHFDLAPMHLEEAPYIGALFIGLSVACILLCVALASIDLVVVWAATGLVNLLGLVAFIVSRTIGLPQIGDDIGNWSDPLGVSTIVIEVLVIGITVAVLRRSTVHSAPSDRQVLDSLGAQRTS